MKSNKGSGWRQGVSLESKEHCRRPDQKYNFIILGFSGAGKGTQAELLASQMDMDIIDGGDYLRQLAASDTPQVRALRKKMSSGHLAPTNIVRAWLKKQILLNRAKGLIISGQPRMISEAKLVLKWFRGKKDGRILKVLFLRVSEKEAVRRLRKRYICENCKKLFIINDYTGKEKCRACRGKIIKRLEDTPLGIKNRLAYFNDQVKKTLAYFKKEGLLVEINGEQSIQKVHRNIIKSIKRFEFN